MNNDRALVLTAADRRRLVRAARRLLGPAEAEDAVQDACLRALEVDISGLRAESAWMLTVVRHLAIDRLRRRRWMQQWSAVTSADDPVPTSPSAECDAARAEAIEQALRRLAAQSSPGDGAAVLLHELFEVGHAEIARFGGRSEAASRQQLRRVLARLRQGPGAPVRRPGSAPTTSEESVFRLYLQALQLRDPQGLWALLGPPPVRASTGTREVAVETAAATRATVCGITHVRGQLGLVLKLDGIILCVLPLGVRAEPEAAASPM